MGRPVIAVQREEQDANAWTVLREGVEPMTRKLVKTGLLVAVATVAVAATAWACVPVASLQVSSQQAAPGDELTVTGRYYNDDNPVSLRWDGLDGRVLGTITPENRSIEGTIRIPANAEPGNYTLVATQDAVSDRSTWGIPSRALVTVVGDAGAPVMGEMLGTDVSERAPALVQAESVGTGEFALVALGVAGVALFAAGAAALMAGRSRREVTETARSVG